RLKRYHSEIRADSAYPFFVFLEKEDVLIGGCTLSNVRRRVCPSARIRHLIGGENTPKRLMYAGGRARPPLFFPTLGLQRLEAACIPDNEPSRRLLVKVGFRQEGKARLYLQIEGAWRDHLLFAMLETEAPVR